MQQDWSEGTAAIILNSWNRFPRPAYKSLMYAIVSGVRLSGHTKVAVSKRIHCTQVGLPETAGSNGKPDDKEKRELHASGSQQEKEKAAERSLDNEAQAQQQLQQLKKQHRLQLQERNRQICHLQEDREKLRRSLRKAESDLRSAHCSAPTAQVLQTTVAQHC